MTEQEWLTSDSPEEMLQRLETTTPGDRKLRLFAVACIRATSNDPFVEEECQVVERYADALATLNELEWVFGYPDNIDEEEVPPLGKKTLSVAVVSSIANDAAAAAAARATTFHAVRIAKESAQATQADLVRCIFGNPFRPAPTLPPLLLTAPIVALVRLIYDDRQFDRLPELAALLKEQGYQHQALLEHLESAGPHARGCWGLDAILGKN